MGILKEQDENCPLAKINILLQFGSELFIYLFILFATHK